MNKKPIVNWFGIVIEWTCMFCNHRQNVYGVYPGDGCKIIVNHGTTCYVARDQVCWKCLRRYEVAKKTMLINGKLLAL